MRRSRNGASLHCFDPRRLLELTARGASSLTPGQTLVTVNGRRGTVGALLGAGGQGKVYRVTVEGLALALKWYHAHYIEIDTGLRLRLETSVRRGAPTENFLWPIDMVTVPGSPSFGYLMPIRPERYTSIRDLIAPPPQRLNLTLAERALVCLQLAECFLELHAAGFCYQDINFGNIFLDPATATILICDNDNVNVDGAEASIYGTRKFMAPEVVRRDALPSSRTDLFSMAVLFFYTIFGWHPLDGAREHAVGLMDADAELRLYGSEPRFLFDPDDTSNGPVARFHDPLVARWKSLSPALRALFVRAFGAGLNDPGARVMETEWRPALATLVDAAFACSGCGFEQVARCRGDDAACLSCESEIDWPLTLALGGRTILLADGRSFALDSRDRRRSNDARVEVHPRRPDVIGLRNLTAAPWRVTMPGGSAYRAEAGQAVRIVAGERIEFGAVSGEIVALYRESVAA